MEKFDIAIIGGGPAGYAACMRALDYNLKVLLIEKNKIGGAGLYDGALSSKTLWELSKDVVHCRQRVQKFSKTSTFTLDYSVVQSELHQAIAERAAQLEGHLNSLQDEGFRGLFFLKYGAGKFLTKNEIEITKNDGTKEVIFAENSIIATGSRPRKIPNIPIDEKTIVTSDTIHSWEKLPKSMVILGAGVIGCEYATIFSNFGETKVNIIDKCPRILPFEDDDVTAVVQEEFEKNGVTIHRNSKLESMQLVDGMVEYVLSYEDGSKDVHLVEKALVSIGRVANIESLGLEEIGIELTERGSIKDNDTQTSVENIYAIGDVTADIALVNVGELEGRHAVKKILSKTWGNLSYDNVSTIMFIKPIVAGVGMNEKQARQKGIPYQVVSIDYSIIPRAIAMRNPPGFFKILVTNDKEMKILGMRAVGVHASSAIQAVALLISQGKGVKDLAELIHPHPSLIEGIQECCRMLLGKSIFKPHVFGEAMRYAACIDGVYEDMAQIT